MFDSLWSLLGCRHRRLTRPITPVTKIGGPSGETYVTCLDCGKKFTYDWKAMRMGKAIANADKVLYPERK